MANELKEAFLRSWFDVPEGVHWAHGMSNEVEKEVSESFDRAMAAMNTRPAAPMETVAALRINGEPIKSNDIWLYDDTTPLITRSQAEAIIAAKDREIAALNEQIGGVLGLAEQLHSAGIAYQALQDDIAALPHLPLGYGVKKLEWEETSYGTPEIFTEVGVYRINHAYNGGWSLNRNNKVIVDHDGRTNFATIETAKAAAQADFERRVRECMVAKTVEVLDDASIQAKVSEIGNQIHNLGCEHQNNEALSDRLKELRDHLWDISKNCTKPVDVAEVLEIGEDEHLLRRALTWRERITGRVECRKAPEASNAE